MILHELCERIALINLDYKPDRLGLAKERMQAAGVLDPAKVVRVRAVSGDMCPPPAWWGAGNGAWGCLMSHVRCVQDAVMDGVESLLVLEDDAIWHPRAAEILERFAPEIPDDWGQIYIGGQHLSDPAMISPMVLRCKNVNRTHGYILRKTAMRKFLQHVCHAPDYIGKTKGWHIDHQLGTAHGRGDWATYAPSWWPLGQDGGASNISGRMNPPLWWQPTIFTKTLPIAIVTPEDASKVDCEHLHFGNNLIPGTMEDKGVADACKSSRTMRTHLTMISREAGDMGLIPAISAPTLPVALVRSTWTPGVIFPTEKTDFAALCDYPFNGLITHPLAESDKITALQTSSAA